MFKFNGNIIVKSPRNDILVPLSRTKFTRNTMQNVRDTWWRLLHTERKSPMGQFQIERFSWTSKFFQVCATEVFVHRNRTLAQPTEIWFLCLRMSVREPRKTLVLSINRSSAPLPFFFRRRFYSFLHQIDILTIFLDHLFLQNLQLHGVIDVMIKI